jgi:hypothetical protein
MGRPPRKAVDADDPLLHDAMVNAPMVRSGGPGAPAVYQEPADWLKKIYEAAADNAQPPGFLMLMPVGKPERNGSAGGFALGAAMFIAVGVASAVYWLTVITVWLFLHVLLWLLGLHPWRLMAAGVVAAVGYLYLTR